MHLIVGGFVLCLSVERAVALNVGGFKDVTYSLRAKRALHKLERSFRLVPFHSYARLRHCQDGSREQATQLFSESRNIQDDSYTSGTIHHKPGVGYDANLKKNEELESLRAKAADMKREAARVRLEAERMDANLTMAKIAALERYISLGMLKNKTENAEHIKEKIEVLKDKLNQSSNTGESANKGSSTYEANARPESSTPSASKTHETVRAPVSIQKVSETMPPTDLKVLNDGYSMIPKFIRGMLVTEFDVEADANNTNILTGFSKAIEELEREMKLDPEMMSVATSTFEKLDQSDRNQIAALVDLDSGKAAETIVQKLNERNLIFLQEMEGDDPIFNVVGYGELLSNPVKQMRNAAVKFLLPLNLPREPDEADVDMFVSKALNGKIFKLSNRMERIPGVGYVVSGTNLAKDGDSLIHAIDQALVAISLSDKLNVHYVRVPLGISDVLSGEIDSVQFADVMDESSSVEDIADAMTPPVLLITGGDFPVAADSALQNTLSIFGFASIAAYSAELNSGGYEVSIDDVIRNISSPLFVSVLAIILAREAGQRLAAAIEKIDVTLPAIIPSPDLGVAASVTDFKSAPMNRKSLLNFAVAGPILGIGASLLLLYTGLQATLSVDIASLSLLPTLPTDVIRLSTLGYGIIENMVGGLAIIAADPINETVHLHPVAIAGFIGLIMNGLSLVPVGRTNGGRISRAAFGLSDAIVSTVATVILFFLGFFELRRSTLILGYALFAFIFQGRSNPDIPCRNEVDGLDFQRVLLAIVVNFLAALILFPVT